MSETAPNPIRNMLVGMLMAPDFISIEPGRMFTQEGAELLADKLIEKGILNLNKETILKHSQGFGPELFQSVTNAPDN